MIGRYDIRNIDNYQLLWALSTPIGNGVFQWETNRYNLLFNGEHLFVVKSTRQTDVGGVTVNEIGPIFRATQQPTPCESVEFNQ